MEKDWEKKSFKLIKCFILNLRGFVKWRSSGFGSKYQLLNMF